MGVAGAAIATVLSNIISLMLFIYWRYIKGGELLDLNTYNKNMSIYKDIISVGVPASMEQILMSLFSMIINVILVMVATTEAVAVYTTVWRLISIGVMIPVGFGTGSISIFGALFGARKSETILESFKFTQIIGFVGSVLMAIILAIFSPLLALLFGGAGLNDQIISITVLLSLYVVFSSWSIVSGCILQSFGHGDYSLYFTFFKQIILTLIFIVLLLIIFFTFTLVNTQNESRHISEQVNKLLQVMEDDIPYSANELLTLLNIRSKETLRASYLNPALENGLIKMTLPDKPNSKNQKYIWYI